MLAGQGLLSLLAPPVIGAALGYSASALALRLALRRGRSAPGKPSALASGLGDLVATELLTTETLAAEIRSEGFRERTVSAVEAITSELLSLRASELFSPEEEIPADAPGARSAARELLSSGSASSALGALVRAWAGAVSRMPVEELVRSEGARRLIEAAAAGLAQGASGKELERAVGLLLDALLASEEARADLFSEPGIEEAARTLDAIYPSVVDFLMGWLRSSSTQADLVVRGRLLVRDILDRLTALQRIIVSAAQYDRTIDSNMRGIVQEALDQIEEGARDSQTQARLVEAARRELRSLRSKRVGGEAEEGLKRLAAQAVSGGIAALRGPEARGRLIESLTDLVGGAAGETVGGLVERLFGLQAGGFPRFASDLVSGGAVPGLLSRMPDVAIGALLGIEGERKRRIDRAIAAALIGAAGAMAPDLFASVDVRATVVSKIDGLKPGELEGFMLGALKGWLDAAALFGGALGFVIGAVADLIHFL